jgi:hypothetical protein
MAAPTPPSLQGFYSPVQQVPLSADVQATNHLKCVGGVDGCLSDTAELQRFGQTDGVIEVWEDSRLTAPLRKQLWGRGGIFMVGTANDPTLKTFYDRSPRVAVIILKDTAGHILDLKVLDWPMAEIRMPLFVRPPLRTYLLAVDTSGPSARSGLTGEFLDIDPAKGRLAFERYAAPNSVAIKYPNGVTLQQHWHAYGDLSIPPNGQFELWAAGAQPARFQSSSCAIESYIDPATKQYIFETGDEKVSGHVDGTMWHESIGVNFSSCQDF